jgi:peptide chain release factor 1
MIKDGAITLLIRGENAASLFANERGGHRWQRVPPTENNGRRHSSTITVAVIGGAAESPEFDERDVTFRFCVASVGAGGQNRQKNATACVAIHRPTGIEAQCQDERSQRRNRDKALMTLRRRVEAAALSQAARLVNGDRQLQIGSGERSDKIRTIQVHRGVVTNHRTGAKVSLERYLKGFIEEVQ